MSGGGEMMDGGMAGPSADDSESTAPAGQDAMPRDIPARTFYNKLRERKEMARNYAGMTKEDRRAAMERDQAMKLAPFNAREFFVSQYAGKPADQIIDGLTQYFIGFALDDGQRNRLLTIIGQAVPAGTPVPVEKMAEEDLRATVQLMLSTVEYQVC